MHFKEWITSETWKPPKGEPVEPQTGPNYFFKRHPRNPDLLWEPAEKPFMDAGELIQKVKLFRYNPQRNQLEPVGYDHLYPDEDRLDELPEISIKNPVMIYP
jgi:hypothetical protein